MQAAQSDPYSTATTFLMAMVGLSVAAERVTETIKQWIQLNPNGARSAAVVQTIAVISGVFVSAMSGLNPLPIPGFVPFQWSNHKDWMSWCVTGLLVCGGSAFWNHLLDILQASKVQKEQAVYGTGTPQAPNPAPFAAPPDTFAATAGN